MNKIKLFSEIIKNMGWEYVQFRSFYEFKRKTGILKKSFPLNPPLKKFISLADWKKLPSKFFFESKEKLTFPKNPNPLLKEDFDAFLEGSLKYFNATSHNIGRNYDWLTNPSNDYKYDINQHWTEVEDFSPIIGDIKYVWEKSRFSYLYTLIRYDYHFDKDTAELVFSEIDSWIDANPINQGPNYKCSQEISIRTLNWIFALNYYKNSKALTEDRFQKIIHTIYWQIKHDYDNINFSRKSVRNNHAITEVLTLYLTGLLFPFFPESIKWKEKGKKWFEQEIAYQIYQDGTFLQFSHNYHRVLLQLLTWAFYISDANGEQFSEIVYERAKKTIDYLYQCQELSNGQLPNYGANDGALFFKLNDCIYRDYRPQLNALYHFFSEKTLYEKGIWDEDVNWYTNYHKPSVFQDKTFSLKHRPMSQYTEGGIYLMRDSDSLTFIKCAKYKDRPSHADNLHIDIWYKGENILRDAGTYKYNTDPQFVKYFVGTKSHNTLILGDYDQMLKGPRFIWLNWSKALTTKLFEFENEFVFEGTIAAFLNIDKHIKHTRKIRKHKDKAIWEIEDSITHDSDLPIHQVWNITKNFETQFDIITLNTESNISKNKEKGYYSGLYGVKEDSEAIILSTHGKTIKTIIKEK
jgi:Heparinase II/III-like protein/Heparinase II/III N-terminus